jgi:RNA polymerase sigma factor (sigma-70 family)
MDVARAVADAHRREWAGVLAATVRVTRDLDLAEECVQDAYAKALVVWRARGVPTRPGGWLTVVARNRALDLLRREQALRRRLPLLVEDAAAPEAIDDEPAIPDDRLRLIFTCCHPALAPESQVALTLRLVCGLTTAEVARAFLVSEPTMGARITRAKKKIQVARIPYRVPLADELPDRLNAVLVVTHLVFTTGHTAPVGDQLVRSDLVQVALDLARMLRAILPSEPAVAGLLALFLLTDARRETRTDAAGQLVLLEHQDRARWDRAAIDQGSALLREALLAGRGTTPGRFTVLAAIAAVHAEAPSWAATDWEQIVGLYAVLARVWPSPVVALNRAVAVGFARGPAAGLHAIDELAEEPRLAGYGYLAAARADFLRRLDRIAEARTAYEEALLLTANDVEAAFLRGRLDDLTN